jgi:SAM-dependent methyltransferase
MFFCRSCGLVFDKRIPSDLELDMHYSEYGYSTIKSCPYSTKASFAKVLSSLEPWHGHRRLLDYGCGQGDFLLEALNAGWCAEGYEFSNSAASLCQQRGLQIVKGTSLPDWFTGRFDVITAFEVLEHLRSPGDFFSTASKLLVTGGMLYLTTPNFNSFLRSLEGDSFDILSYPDHLCLFTPRSLRHLATKHGFRIVSLQTTGLDPWRLRRSLSPRQINPPLTLTSSHTSKEIRTAFRDLLSTNRTAAFLKSSVNLLVSTLGVGDTLKAWLVKGRV